MDFHRNGSFTHLLSDHALLIIFPQQLLISIESIFSIVVLIA